MPEEIVKPNQAFGQALVTEAEKRNEDNRREALLIDVARLAAHRDESLEKSDFHKKAADWYTRKLAALEAGVIQRCSQKNYRILSFARSVTLQG